MEKPYPFHCQECDRMTIYPFRIDNKLYCSECGVYFRKLTRWEIEEFRDHVLVLENNQDD